jgi:hypothetical protein
MARALLLLSTDILARLKTSFHRLPLKSPQSLNDASFCKIENALTLLKLKSGGMRAAQRAGEGFRGHLRACSQGDTRDYLREDQRSCHHDDIFLIFSVISVISV